MVPVLSSAASKPLLSATIAFAVAESSCLFIASISKFNGTPLITLTAFSEVNPIVILLLKPQRLL